MSGLLCWLGFHAWSGWAKATLPSYVKHWTGVTVRLWGETVEGELSSCSRCGKERVRPPL